MEITRRRLEALGVAWRGLEILPDVDTVEDLGTVEGDPRVPRGLRNVLRTRWGRG